MLQSYTDWQLIAVDDHSDDQSRALLEKDNDPRIEVYTNEGKGILPALQTAQKHIRGTYVTRMDADDIMPIHKLENLLKLVRSKNGGIVSTGAVNYFSDEEIRASYGFGFNYYSPIGPIGFTWGFPLSSKSYDIERMFLFSIGNLN